MCLCLPLLYLSVFDTDILPKTFFCGHTDFLWTYTCFLLAAVGFMWVFVTSKHAYVLGIVPVANPNF